MNKIVRGFGPSTRVALVLNLVGSTVAATPLAESRQDATPFPSVLHETVAGCTAMIQGQPLAEALPKLKRVGDLSGGPVGQNARSEPTFFRDPAAIYQSDLPEDIKVEVMASEVERRCQITDARGLAHSGRELREIFSAKGGWVWVGDRHAVNSSRLAVNFLESDEKPIPSRVAVQMYLRSDDEMQQPFRLTGWIEPPRLDYPEVALRQGVSGYVSMDCLIDTEGRLSECDIVAEAPLDVGFAQAALAAIPSARAQPSQPVSPNEKRRVRFNMRFSLPD